MKLYDLLLKTISKMPNGWGKTIKVDLTNGWTAPSDGILKLIIGGDKDMVYVSDKGNSIILAALCLYNGRNSTCAPVKKGEVYKISYRGTTITLVDAYFTPFSYRGGCLYRLIKRLQSLFLKGVMA